MDDRKVIGVPPDMSELQFIAVLKAAKSPALSAAHAVYQYCVKRGVSPAFLLALFQHESGMGKAGTATITHSWGNTRMPTHGGVTPVRLTTAGEARSGQFPVFRDWIDGGISTVARLVDYAPYQGKTTVGQIIPTWAPATDLNDPDAYARAVLALIAQWTKATGGTTVVAKPTVIKSPSPNHGYAGDYKPESVVWHITAGSGASALSWLTNPASDASANYLIMEDGRIHELVNPEAGQQGAAWANGDVQKPNLGNPLIASWVKNGINPNRRCVSIEHAGQSSMGKGGGLTAKQVDATIALTAWLCSRFGIAPDRQHILPHAWINSVTRPNCPGFSEQEWNSWVLRIKALVAPLPQPEPPPVPAPSGDQIIPFIHADGRPGVTILFDGLTKVTPSVNVADLGISVPSATTGEMLDQSVQGNQFMGWEVRK